MIPFPHSHSMTVLGVSSQLVHKPAHDAHRLAVVAGAKHDVVIKDVVERVKVVAIVEAGRLGNDLAVARPEVAPEARTPVHAPLSLVVAVVARRVKDDGLAAGRRRDVAAPQVAMQD
eukprot:295148-Chlamydomonas_euryale.AAC.5